MFHSANKSQYAEVILPLAIRTNYSYLVPEDLVSKIEIGMRVEVPLKNKLYSGVVLSLSNESPDSIKKIRAIRAVLDNKPIIDKLQFKVWNWMAGYYCCSLGEVMNMVIPAGLKLNSETKFQVAEDYKVHIDALHDKEFLLAEAISIQKEINLDTAKDILGQKTVLPHLRSLLDKGVINIEEELIERYKLKYEDYISLASPLDEAFEMKIDTLTKRSKKQQRAMEGLVTLLENETDIAKSRLIKYSETDSATVKALQKKELIHIEKREITRLKEYAGDVIKAPPLSEAQTKAYKEIKEAFKEKDQVLLFGVTGSGKTRIYIELIKEALDKGEQVLYLVPEIALTTQLVQRLQKVFGDKVHLYHSKLNNNARVELFQSAAKGKEIFMGARSSLFLPFKKLGLIIVDEEHDQSYKQNDPAPRYNARDTSIYIANLHKGKVLLGSATPSLESYRNAINEKYALVKLLTRHGNSTLPEIQLVDLRKSYKEGEIKSHFSTELLQGIKNVLATNQQVLLFQNRRGYAHTLKCPRCDWHAGCPNCDVSMTVHQYFQELRCHYCSARSRLHNQCPSCGYSKLNKLGFGTEKIEVELQKLLPMASIARLDYDSAKTRSAYERILTDFELKKIDILVGTQMITKGLDFESIALVGVLLADKSLFFPDFRANERSIQLFTQVAGRAGRREKKGKVILQTFSPEHPVIKETITNNLKSFYDRETNERNLFKYPPFFRLINITLKHKDPKTVREAAMLLAKVLKEKLGNRVLGPTPPGIARIRGLYIEQLVLKMEKKSSVIIHIKSYLLNAVDHVRKTSPFKSVRIILDVDP